MKNAEIRDLSLEELKQQVKTEQSQRPDAALRARHLAPGEPAPPEASRKNVARLLTELKRRENEQATNTAN